MFLPLNYCDSEHVMEKISGICLLHPPWLLCISYIVHHGTQNPVARLLVGWRHYFNRSHQICVSVQLEPKWQFWTAGMLDCLIGIIYGNHMEIMPWFWEPNLTWLHHWGSEWHLRVQTKHASMSSSLSHHSVLPGWVNSWKAPRPC